MKESKKSPSTAAVLNFFIWGLGYVYLGKAWGIALVIFDIILCIVLFMGYFITGFMAGAQGASYEFGASDWALNFFFLIISVVLAWHAYEMAKEMNEELSK